jgi:hypothetical protein
MILLRPASHKKPKYTLFVSKKKDIDISLSIRDRSGTYSGLQK